MKTDNCIYKPAFNNKYASMRRFYSIIFLFVFLLHTSYAQTASEINDASEPKYLPTILVVEDDGEAADLEAQGVIIWHRREDMALALIPLDETERISRKFTGKNKRFRNLYPRKNKPLMDVAKTYFGAEQVLKGQDLPQSYTGKGVVVGFCDIGFDPNHINFKDSQGRSRVKRLLFYDEPHGIRKIMDDKKEIESWTTDNTYETHATHVAGIMAGSYNDGNYGGMAPDSEIVAATSRLYDMGLLAACEDIIDYAKSVGKPAVINLSVGSYNGPHDGSTLFNRYMDLLGEEAVICMSAGNEGSYKGSHKITFSDSLPSWRCRLFATNYTQFDIYGMTDIWSSDSNGVRLKLHVFDEVSNSSVYESDWLDSSSGSSFSFSMSDDPVLSSMFTGELEVEMGISELNDRWFAEITYDVHTDIGNPLHDEAWARYNLALEIEGEPGVHVDVTADSQYTWLAQWPGYEAPGSQLSISDICTGENVVSVGMYNNRAEIPNLDGTFKSTGLTPLQIHRASSYGTLLDGRVLPLTVAPGGMVVSSASNPYLNANQSAVSDMDVRKRVEGKDYYWFAMTGTSMSSPYVAGAIATWMEADPSLTISDVKRIIALSNSKDCYDASDPKNGQGWFHPYKGMVEVVKNSGLTTGAIDSTEVKTILLGERIEILNPAANELSIAVYSVNGSLASPKIITQDKLKSVDISSLTQGIYILSVDSELHAPVVTKFIRR